MRRLGAPSSRRHAAPLWLAVACLAALLQPDGRRTQNGCAQIQSIEELMASMSLRKSGTDGDDGDRRL